MSSVELFKLPEGKIRTTPNPAEIREAILRLEAMMLSLPPATPDEIGAIEIVPIHHFSPGIYMREIRIPKGTLLTGKIHKEEHLNILSRGELAVITDQGPKRLLASSVIPSMPGIKRVGFALQDCVWITVHSNPLELRDPEALEDRLVFQTNALPPGWVKHLLTEGGDVCPS